MSGILQTIIQRKALCFGFVTLGIFVALAVLAPWIAPYDPVVDADLMVASTPPGAEYWLGTDAQGRDILSRILYGARISLTVGLLVQLVNSLIGIALGLSAGYFGGWWDDLVSGLTNVMLAIPSLVFALAIMALLGPGLINLLIALGVTQWSYTCRITRSQVLTARALPYVQAARGLGYGHGRIMLTQILPNIVGPIIVIASLGIGAAILNEAALSFLGLGVQPPWPSWGNMLSDARDEIFSAPWISMFPGCAIFICVLAFNMLGDGLRDVLDPHSHLSHR
jgi:peptide/nickel transport system permease protein